MRTKGYSTPVLTKTATLFISKNAVTLHTFGEYSDL